VGRTDLVAVLGEALGIRYRYQAEVADQPPAVEFVEITRLDVPVGDAGRVLQPGQRAGDRGGCRDDIGQRPAFQGLGDGCDASRTHRPRVAKRPIKIRNEKRTKRI